MANEKYAGWHNNASDILQRFQFIVTHINSYHIYITWRLLLKDDSPKYRSIVWLYLVNLEEESHEGYLMFRFHLKEIKPMYNLSCVYHVTCSSKNFFYTKICRVSNPQSRSSLPLATMDNLCRNDRSTISNPLKAHDRNTNLVSFLQKNGFTTRTDRIWVQITQQASKVHHQRVTPVVYCLSNI